MSTPEQGRLFEPRQPPEAAPQRLADGAWLLPGWARPQIATLVSDLERILAQAPPRHMYTPGGQCMSVAITNCGNLGWITDRRGYRYVTQDPESGRDWPAMPETLRVLAVAAAAAAGYAHFAPDACLVNRYEPGARMSLHQDRNEQDLSAPVVSVSVGLPAVFLFGGALRTARPQRLLLTSGDVVVWGGPSRLFYHGVAPLAVGCDPDTGACRYNFTLRRAGA
jgi:DNA oxidative demethylase